MSPKSIPTQKTTDADITIIDDDDEQITEIEETDKNSNEYKINKVMEVSHVSKEVAVEALERNNFDLIETFQDL